MGNRIKKKKKTTTTDILSFLKTTGFLFEMEVAKNLKSRGYNIYPNEYFLDLEGDKEREIDIIAVKAVNNIKICLVIECKQSLNDSWVFICSKQKPKRRRSCVKYLPAIDMSNEFNRKVFNKIHVLDSKNPLAQNYIVFNNGKKGDDHQINDSLLKIPKALIGAGTRIEKEKRTILFPIIIFSGQIFTVKHNGNTADAKEVSLVQYEQIFNSKDYQMEESEYSRSSLSSLQRILPVKGEEEKRIAQEFRDHFIIDFVNQKGLKKYISMIEGRIAKIKIDEWPLKK